MGTILEESKSTPYLSKGRQEMLERYKEIWKDGLLSQPLDKVIGLEDKRKMFKDYLGRVPQQPYFLVEEEGL